LTVQEIVSRYPEGAKLTVYIADVYGGPGPVYLGQFVVGDRTIRHAETGQTWGDVQEEAMSYNGGRRLQIVNVEQA
jgi:hypothetical protein